MFATSGTWPRMKALYCRPIPIDEWPAGTEVVEGVELRSCRRRGAAIDVLATGIFTGGTIPGVAIDVSDEAYLDLECEAGGAFARD